MFKVLSYTNTLEESSTSNNYVELISNDDFFIDKTLNKPLASIFSNTEETYDFLRNFADKNRDGVVSNDKDENYLVTNNNLYIYNNELYLKAPTGIALSGNKILVNRPDFFSLERQLFNKTLTDYDVEKYEVRTDLSTGKLWARTTINGEDYINYYLYFGCTDVEWNTNVTPASPFNHPIALLEGIAASTDDKIKEKITDITSFVSYPIFKLTEGDYLLYISGDEINVKSFSAAKTAGEIPLSRIVVAANLSFTIKDYREFLVKVPISPSDETLNAYWSMEDLPAIPDGESGYYITLLNDNSGNNLNGTIYNCTSVKGVEGGALMFGTPISKTNSKVTVTVAPRLISGGSIFALFKGHTTQINPEAFIVDKSSGLATDYTIKIDSGILKCCVGDPANFVSYPVSHSTNYYVAFTFDANWMKLYINNKLVDKKENALLPSDTEKELAIGNRAGVGTYDKPFSGLIDEVKIYSSVLTADEIDGLGTYKSASKLSLGSVVGYLRNNDITFGKDVTVEGNLTVIGETTTSSASELTVEDVKITLNINQIGTPLSTLISGIEIERGDEPNYSFKFRESDDTFVVGELGSEQPVATREATPQDRAIPVWDAASFTFVTDNKLTFANDKVTINTSTVSTNTTSGSLVVTGGVGIGGAINIGGSATIASDSKINSVDIGMGAGNISSNTRVGVNALNVNTTGAQNTAIGASALYTNSIGYNNTAIGYYSLYNNTTGFYNTAIGHNTLFTNSIGSFNTAVGYRSLYYNTGNYNTAIGYSSLNTNSTGVQNTAIGFNSLFNNTIGVQNTAIGYDALYSNITGYGNIAIGHQAGYYETGFNKLFIDNLNRTNETGGRTQSFIYGDMSAKTLLINADITTDKMRLRNATVATASDGALIVDGGVDIAANLMVESTTASSNYTTGATIISGGVGIAGAVNTNSTMSVGGALTVNGAALNTPATFSLGSIATALTIGATTGTTNIRNALTVQSLTIGTKPAASVSDAIKYALVLG